MKCRCYICGRNNASRKNKGKSSYIRCKVFRDERNLPVDAKGKRQERRLRRCREKRMWKMEVF